MWSATGNMVAQPADIDSIGVSSVAGSGVLATVRSTIIGAEGVVVIQGSADLRAQLSNSAGAGLAIWRMSGTLPANDSKLIGTGVSESKGTGIIDARNATIVGFASLTAYGIGTLTTRDAAISGSNLIVGSGILVVDTTATLIGLGDVGEPVLPEPTPLPGGYPGTVSWAGYTTALVG
jgi:hypothetical protein